MIFAAHVETKAFSEVRVEATVEVCFFADFGMWPITTCPNTLIGSLVQSLFGALQPSELAGGALLTGPRALQLVHIVRN